MKRVFLWIWLAVSGLVALGLLYAAIVCFVKSHGDGGWKVGGIVALVAVAFGWSTVESYRRRRFKFLFFE